MNSTSDSFYNSITITEAYMILEQFMDKSDVYHDLIPKYTYEYYPNDKVSYEEFEACINQIRYDVFEKLFFIKNTHHKSQNTTKYNDVARKSKHHQT